MVMSLSVAPDDITQCCADKALQLADNNCSSILLDAKRSRKRKHAEAELSSHVGRLHKTEIVLPRLDGSNQALIPKYLIPRSFLPLAYLDPVADGEIASGSRLFTAQIDSLEEVGDECQFLQPQVLLARSIDCGRFYAVEKVHAGAYAFCRLGKWVAESALEELAQRVPAQTFCQPRTASREEQNVPKVEWWRTALAPNHDLSHLSSLDPDAIVRARNFKLSIGRHPVDRPSGSSLSPVPVQVATSPPAIEKGAFEQKEAFNDGIQNSEEILKIIKTQYQDALYLSRAPLAYFAKGPLSRARASFQHDDGLGNDHSKLTQYLRTMILDLQVMDKKYRETLPVLVNGYPFLPLSDGEGAPIIEEFQRKTRKSKKEKVGKDGLYAGEDANIARWWLGREKLDILRDTEDAHQDSIKAAVLSLRRREAQLQIILLLETLALEESSLFSVGKLVDLANTGHQREGVALKGKKVRKPQDLRTLLDLLADRLCIWQSMSVEGERPIAKQGPQDSIIPKNAGHHNDELRQFCIDVIVPFYGSRLPEASTLLCQKLGGPKDPSPKRPATKILEVKSRTSTKPGAPLMRPQPRRHQRTLERVLTAERSSHRRKMPSLSRSATEPLVQIKREVSDSTLSSIPVNKVTMSKRYTQREVDLRASTQAAESKKKKKIAIEQELQGAIAAIKRPNPKMAGVEFVEAVEKRQADTHSRKTVKSMRKSLNQDCQVMATPSKNKNAGAYSLPTLPQSQYDPLPSEASEVPPSSANQVVPSSTGKPLNPNSYGKSQAKGHDRNQFARIDQTPSRGPAKYVDRSFLSTGQAPVFEYSQPQAKRPPTNSVQETPSKPSDNQSSTPPKPKFNIQLTPCKAVPVLSDPLDAPSPLSQAEEPDVYASLGWNYEVDD